MYIPFVGNIKIRNLDAAASNELVSGNFVATALDTDKAGLPKETKKATFYNVVSGALGAPGTPYPGDITLTGTISGQTSGYFDALYITGSQGKWHQITTGWSGGAGGGTVGGKPVIGGDATEVDIGGEGGDTRPVNFTHDGNTKMTVDAAGVKIDTLLLSDGAGGYLTAGSEVAFLDSDKRLKEDITPLGDPQEKLNQLDGVTFVWNDKATEDMAGKPDVGVIAQQVQQVLPTAIKKNSNGYLGVHYYKIIPLLIETVKQQEQRISDLEKRINNG